MNLTEQQKLEILCAYLPHGVECMNEDDKIILIGIRSWIGWCGVHKFEHGDNNISINHIKPILRHPDDMTEEELRYLANNWGSEFGRSILSNETPMYLVHAQECLRYLHSIHIDTFGAIESGFAIRK